MALKEKIVSKIRFPIESNLVKNNLTSFFLYRLYLGKYRANTNILFFWVIYRYSVLSLSFADKAKKCAADLFCITCRRFRNNLPWDRAKSRRPLSRYPGKRANSKLQFLPQEAYFFKAKTLFNVKNLSPHVNTLKWASLKKNTNKFIGGVKECDWSSCSLSFERRSSLSRVCIF